MNRVRVPLIDRRLRYAAVLGVALLIVAASVTRPSPGAPDVVFGVPLDKVLHALAYAGFAALLAYALLPPGAPLSARTLALVVVVAVAFGAGVELLQGALPYRSMSLADAAADLAGAVAGTLPFLFARGRRRVYRVLPTG